MTFTTRTGAIRWYVRLAPSRDLRFGETARDVLMWSVFPYTHRDSAGEPVPTQSPTFFASRGAAIALGRRMARMTYGTGGSK